MSDQEELLPERSIAVGPSRDALTWCAIVGSALMTGISAWQSSVEMRANHQFVAIVALAICAGALVSVARPLFQLLSREEIFVDDKYLVLTLRVVCVTFVRRYDGADVSRPGIEQRRYVGKHGSSTVLRFAFEHRGITQRGRRYLSRRQAD